MAVKAVRGAVFFLLGAAAALFLWLRLCAFTQQAWAFTLPCGAAKWGAALIGGGAAIVFSERLAAYMKKYALGAGLKALAFTACCCALCVFAPRLLLDRMVTGSDVAVWGFARYFALIGAGALLALFLLHLGGAVRALMPGAKLRSAVRKIRVSDVVFAAALLAFIMLAVLLYSRGSSTIYFWDNAGFWTSAGEMAELLRGSGAAALIKYVYGTVFTTDYNMIIALPAAVLSYLFDPSRLVFVEGIAVFGWFPMCLVFYVFMRRRTKRAMLLTACMCLAFPMMFFETVTGFIDIYALVPAALAVLLWLGSGRDVRPARFLVIGCLLAACVLLRRWMAFFALSYMIALAVDCVFFRRSAVPMAAALCTFAFSLLFMFQPFVSQKLMADYSGIYSAYASGLMADIKIFFRYYGLVPVLLLAVGGGWLAAKKESRGQGVFLILQPLVCFLLFTRVQTHGQHHLLLYVPAFYALFCLSADMLLSIQKKRAACALLAAAVLLPLISPFLPWPKYSSSSEITHPTALPSFSYTPPSREDAYDVVSMVQWLDENIGEQGKTVALAASSFVINLDILFNAEASLGISRVSDCPRDYILPVSQVDLRDGFSLNMLKGDYIAVAEPVQLHLGRENQAVIAVPAECVLSGECIGAAYRRLDVSFELGGGVTVYIYEKTRECTPDELERLYELMYEADPAMRP